MKPMKVAAVVAGSVMAMGVASPAFAAPASPVSLNGALDSVGGKALKTDALTNTADGSAVGSVVKTTDKLNATTKATQLLGGVPLGQ